MTRTRLLAVYSLAGVLCLVVALIPGCSSDSDSPTGGSSTITVTGHVVSSQLRPVANAPVVITGYPSTTSDANGAFTVSGVTPPYDVTVVISSTKLGITYRGLTRSDPTLVNLFSTPPAVNNAAVSGTVSGGAGYPLPVNHTSNVVYISPEASGGSIPNSLSGAYSLGLSWDGNSTTSGTLHALQWQTTPAGMPQTYTGYATKAGVIVSAGGSFAGHNLAMASVTGGTISGTITVPATVTLGSKVLALAFSSNRSITLGSEGGTSAAFTYNVPNVTGTTITLSATGTGGGGLSIATKTGIAVGATGVGLTLPEVPQLSLPVDAATNVTNATPFAWTAIPSMVYLILFNGPAGEPDYLIVTGTATTTIPDLTSLGLGLPAGTGYSWGLYVFGPNASIDAAAGPNGFVPVGDAMNAMSSTRTFTTAP
jgi:hypothetical protein